MYTHDKLWPEMSDLAASLGSKCNIIDADSGGNCFDEAASTPWARLAEKFPSFPIPMACQSTTVELRGEADVSIQMICVLVEVLFPCAGESVFRISIPSKLLLSYNGNSYGILIWLPRCHTFAYQYIVSSKYHRSSTSWPCRMPLLCFTPCSAEATFCLGRGSFAHHLSRI